MRIEFRNNPGFALPLILVILVIASIGGVVATNMASDHAHHSRSLNASIRAARAAESGGAYVVNDLAAGDGEFEWGFDFEDPVGLWRDGESGQDLWRVDSVRYETGRALIAVSGADAQLTYTRQLRIVYVLDTDTESAFNTAVVGCKGATISGSGRIDSYDSNAGPYNPASSGAMADVTVIDGDLTLSGRSHLMGEVKVNGAFNMSASDIIGGNVEATGNMRIDGTVHGDVSTNQNFTMGNSTASIHGTTWARGNVAFTNGGISCNQNGVHYGGTFIPPWSTWCSGPGERAFLVADPNIKPVAPPKMECDPLNVDKYVDERLENEKTEGVWHSRSGNLSTWQQAPHVFNQDTRFTSSFNPGSNKIHFNSGSLDRIFVEGNFTVAGGAEVRIAKPPPGEDGRVRLFIDGNFELGGGAKFIIEDGASLEVYATGKVSLGGGLENINEAPTLTITDEKGDPVAATSFVIYTSTDRVDGVRVGGNTQIFASIYAPNAKVEIDGSGGLYGAVRGRLVDVKGSGGIHFDETLAQVKDAVIEADGKPRVACWSESLLCY